MPRNLEKKPDGPTQEDVLLLSMKKAVRNITLFKNQKRSILLKCGWREIRIHADPFRGLFSEAHFLKLNDEGVTPEVRGVIIEHLPRLVLFLYTQSYMTEEEKAGEMTSKTGRAREDVEMGIHATAMLIGHTLGIEALTMLAAGSFPSSSDYGYQGADYWKGVLMEKPHEIVNLARRAGGSPAVSLSSGFAKIKKSPLLPFNENMGPVNDSMSGYNENTLPVYDNKSPYNENILPYNENMAPVNDNIWPLNDNISPYNENTLPVNENMSPVNQNISPVNENTTWYSHNAMDNFEVFSSLPSCPQGWDCGAGLTVPDGDAHSSEFEHPNPEPEWAPYEPEVPGGNRPATGSLAHEDKQPRKSKKGEKSQRDERSKSKERSKKEERSKKRENSKKEERSKREERSKKEKKRAYIEGWQGA
ncbi:trans-activating transcriptional regulator domain-containing protein [Pochonia chlamydosporia 170]|uniref:Trans-activating transcriptional regulator domain-containing protein n=1 Tax=Pochonia chlamydosporia 170 TaxID=1380566 RepID=A0A179F861_METCM|nr:trans-activating transcriptional regulator domain-containing protein [Pochonia chlamydosporia 170]OAQ61622.1 trans-activating transcriptional regulator domain-containing protein [Pochonia chlamydosporia 170]